MESSKILQVDYCTHENPLLDYLKQHEIKYENVFQRNDLNLLSFDTHNNIGKLNFQSSEKPYFVKFCPLVDPIKYITNSYTEQKVITNTNDIDLEYVYNHEYVLPLHNDKTFEENMKKLKHTVNYPMNCAYIDTMFMHLSNLLQNEINFQHGIHVYDSYTSIKYDYRIDIGDSLECIDQNKGMYKNVKQEFVEFEDDEFQRMYLETNNIPIDSDDEDEFINNSRTRKPILKISTDNEIKLDLSDEVMDDTMNIDSDIISIENEEKINEDDENNSVELNIEEDSDFKLNKNNYDSSSCEDDDNSEESFTDEEDELLHLVDHKELNMEIPLDDENSNRGSDGSDFGSNDESDEDTDDEPEVYVRIKKIPVQTIIMEKCKNTLDCLLDEDKINMEQLKSALFQVIMNLLCYQKTFKMTHNDLHTNNVMYTSTKRKFLYYIYDGIQYKVPTYGKIYKVLILVEVFSNIRDVHLQAIRLIKMKTLIHNIIANHFLTILKNELKIILVDIKIRMFII